MNNLRIPLAFIVAFFISALTGCSEPPELKPAPVKYGRVESTVSSVTSGTVKAEKVAELAFGAVGRVQSLNIKLGDRVKKGQILSEIENTELLTAVNVTRAEFERRRDLQNARASSPQEYERAQAAFESAKAAYEKSIIRAPYDGIIVELNLEVGQLSQITTINPKTMIRIADLAPRFVRAEMDEVDLSRVKVGMPAEVKILALRREPFKAAVRQVVPFVSSAREQDRTAEFELTVENEGILLPAGASADVEVVVGQKDNVLNVPARTVLGRGGQRYVFCFKDGRAVRTPVEIGILNYDVAEIVSGLQEGDVVLFPSEAVELKDDIKVRVAGGGTGA